MATDGPVSFGREELIEARAEHVDWTLSQVQTTWGGHGDVRGSHELTKTVREPVALGCGDGRSGHCLMGSLVDGES